MSPSIQLNSVWKYIGPCDELSLKGQIHKVMEVNGSVVTIGTPFGRGGSWMGPVELFRRHFDFISNDAFKLHFKPLDSGGWDEIVPK